jgi:RHS repeat-associated protein
VRRAFPGFEDRDYRQWTEVQCPGGEEICEVGGTPGAHEDYLGQTTFSYDSAGNRTDLGATRQAGSNRYGSFDGYTLTYDLDGNLTRKYKTGFDQYLYWNAVGQLDSVRTNGVKVAYGYNAYGVRIRRTQGSTTTYSIYDGDDLLAEVDAAGNPIREYTCFPGVDQPHSVRVGAQAYDYALDELGNVVGLYDCAGTPVNQYAYTPYGQAESVSESVANPLRFSAREVDLVSGLHYFRTRWYDAHQGRFVSQDPIGLYGGLNTDASSENDPVNNADPFGLSTYCRIVIHDWVTIDGEGAYRYRFICYEIIDVLGGGVEFPVSGAFGAGKGENCGGGCYKTSFSIEGSFNDLEVGLLMYQDKKRPPWKSDAPHSVPRAIATRWTVVINSSRFPQRCTSTAHARRVGWKLDTIR